MGGDCGRPQLVVAAPLAVDALPLGGERESRFEVSKKRECCGRDEVEAGLVRLDGIEVWQVEALSTVLRLVPFAPAGTGEALSLTLILPCRRS